MNRFVQFIFVLLFSGILMAMLIVYSFTQRSARNQARELEQAQNSVRAVLDQIQGQSLRGDLAVEWQRVASDGKILETSLVWQTHNVNSELHGGGAEAIKAVLLGEGDKPLPIEHFVIPGDKLNIDGVAFRFSGDFNSEMAYVRGRTICLLNFIYGEDQKPSTRARLNPLHVAPVALLVDPHHATLLEKQLWQRIWALYLDRGIKHLDSTGLEIVDIPAATRRVERGKLYHVWIGRNLGDRNALGIDIDEDKARDSEELLRRAADTQPAS